MDINQNLGNLMKEAQKMQQRMQDAQQQLSELKVTKEVGGGKVKLTMNGRHEALEFNVHQSLMDDDVEMLESLVVAVINACVRDIEKISQDKIRELTAGLKLPTDLQGKTEKE